MNARLTALALHPRPGPSTTRQGSKSLLPLSVAYLDALGILNGCCRPRVSLFVGRRGP